MKSPWTTVIIAVLSVFVVLVAAGQMFFTHRSGITTEVALAYDHEENVPFDGVFMRDETLIYNNGSGVLSFEYDDGTKVGNNSVIARWYQNEYDSVYLRRAEELKKQIDVLTSAEKLIGTDSSQLEAISAQINESHSAIVSAMLDGDYALAASKQNSLLEAMCKREITLNKSHGYAEQKMTLEAESKRLKDLISGGARDVLAGSAGYFVSGVDGYESEIGFENISGMSADKIAEIIDNPVKEVVGSAIGKLVSDYHWRAAAVIDAENLDGISKGDTVELRVGSEGQRFKVELVSKEKLDDDKMLCVFECDELSSVVVKNRTARFKLIINSYGGLRIPRKALRYNENGERGVFVENGQTLVFKKVDVIYWGEDYVISRREVYKEKEDESGEDDDYRELDEDYIKLYDIIVTEGKDLYDGKFVG